MLPTETIPLAIQLEGDVYDTGFAGLPFEAVPVPVLQWIYLLLFVGWIGLLLLTWYSIKESPYTKVTEMDADHLIIMVAWGGLLVMTAYVIRILHGP